MLITQHLLPWLSRVRLDAISATDQRIDIELTTTQAEATCPLCGTCSRSVHSRYDRTVADLAWTSTPVQLSIHTRRFFCRNPTCVRIIFTERLPTLVAPSARRSRRLATEQRHLALDQGGEAGARTATRQGMPVSPRTMMRLIKRTPMAQQPTPRVLGVDDFAFRKGQTYGTILVDLERHQPVDMLPDRSAASLQTWLEQHPGVAIITRDRGADYADGAKRGAPDALQVADRFHLLQNLRELAQRLFERHHWVLKYAMGDAESTGQPEPTPTAAPDETTQPQPALPAPRTHLQRVSVQRRAARVDRYTSIQGLHAQGFGIRAIARQLRLSRRTVRRMIGAASFPEQSTRPHRPSKLDAHQEYLRAQLRLGHANATALWRALRDQHGYTGSRSLVAGWVAQNRQLCPPPTNETRCRQRGRPPTTAAPPPPATRGMSARQAAWLLIQRADEVAEEHHIVIARLCEQCADIQISYPLIQEFLRIVRERHPDALDGWVLRASEQGIAELRSFAAGLRRDSAAVRAALSTPLSNAQVEGQINRLKCIKRTGYGRAKFELLHQRVLAR